MDASLERRLRLPGAVGVGLGAMVGAGLFVVFPPAVRAAGPAVWIALAAAAAVAACNAASSARLARLHPRSGGAYVYGTEHLGPAWGHLAGWSFVAGKTASCAAMALTLGLLLADAHPRVVAVGALAAALVLTLGGVERSARTLLLVVLVVLVGLGVVLGVVASSSPSTLDTTTPDRRDVLEAAALLFFAFAGYARLATLGEEVVAPARTIPRAVAIAVLLTTAVYAATLAVLVHALGIGGVAASTTPLPDAARAVDRPGLEWIIGVVAVLAAGGALLSLVLGVSRTVFAMARDGYLPARLAHVNRRRVPDAATATAAVVAAVLVLATDVVTSIAFSSFCVLVYYAIANAAALRVAGGSIAGRAVAAIGLVGCATLSLALPATAVLSGLGVVLLGILAGQVGRASRRGA